MLETKKAFTLIESVIVLSLTVLIISLPSWTLKRQLQKTQEVYFYQEFVNQWRYARQLSVIKAHKIKLNYLSQSQKIVFNDLTSRNRWTLELPKSVKLVSNAADFNRIKFIPNMSIQPQTIRFNSTITHQEKTYKVQMMWGIIHET